ncbi:MAG TPA: NeuD/PglB/VioB family sugar acetyltransferase [Vicinamibacterales bacterium]|nr:NeuD/PglB/VioB family sugar acetyltransferase [Vicinamibacterales bacterium]
MKRLLILGAGVFAEEVADLAATAGFEVVGFVEGRDRDRGGTLLGRPIHWIDDLAESARGTPAVCAVGSPARAGLIARARALGVRFATLVHPTAVLAASATIGEGSIVGAGVIAGAAVAIGQHAILNRACLIGHHVRIGDCATLCPGCNVGGLTVIGAGAFLGLGSIVIDRIVVGDGAVVGAGSVVNHNVPPGVRVAGVPARRVRRAENLERGPGA